MYVARVVVCFVDGIHHKPRLSLKRPSLWISHAFHSGSYLILLKFRWSMRFFWAGLNEISVCGFSINWDMATLLHPGEKDSVTVSIATTTTALMCLAPGTLTLLEPSKPVMFILAAKLNWLVSINAALTSSCCGKQ